MPAVAIIVADLQKLAPQITTDAGNALITGVLARAAKIAPCILSVDFAYADAAKSLLVDVIVRRAESGAGALTQTQTSTGPFSHSETRDTRNKPGRLFTDAEEAELRGYCAATSDDQVGVGPVYSMPDTPTSPWYPERSWSGYCP